MANFVRKSSFFLALIVVASCSSEPKKMAETSDSLAEQGPATLDDVTVVDDTKPSRLDVLLSNGEAPDSSSAQVPVAKAEPLSAKATMQVLSRLSDLDMKPDDAVDFAKRDSSKPPPRTADVVKTSFPPQSDRERPDVAPQNADAPLKVLRHQPEGDVPIAPHVSVTFDQPMVDVTSHADTIAKGVPVKIEPQPDGQWRWVGTKTLLFEPDARRFPMSTEYRVSIPDSTESKLGNSLESSKSWTFRTPTLQLENYYPRNGTYGLEQPIFINFNQEVDSSKLAPYIELVVNGGPETVDARVVDAGQVSDEQIAQHVANAQPGRFLVLEPAEELPYDSSITVRIKKGAPSAEGPRRTENEFSFSFRTYGPLVVTEHRCGWSGCGPNDAFQFRFSNKVDADAFETADVKVEPSFPTMNVNQWGNSLVIAGRKPGRRTYTVTLDRELTDEFGQTLLGQNTFEFEVGPADPALYSTSGNFTILDPSSKPQFSVFTTNYSKLEVEIWKVEPRDWGAFLQYERDYRYYGKKELTPPGKKVRDDTITIEERPDDLVETAIDLSPVADEAGHGNFVITVRPPVDQTREEERRYIPRVTSWVQSTDLAVDAFVDRGEFIAWATTLAEGEPIDGATIEFGSGKISAKTNEKGVASIDATRFVDGASAAEIVEIFTGEDDVLIVRKGDDMAFLPQSTYPQGRSVWHNAGVPSSLSWFVFDDRQMYKPDETVTVKGWIRRVSNLEDGQVDFAPGVERVKWTAYGPRNNPIADGTTDATALGGFSFDLELPDTVNLGWGRIELDAIGASGTGARHNHRFQIQEFRTPEFEVKASAEEGPHFAGGSAVATVEANYYAGGGLPNAEVNWNVSTSAATYRPPNLEDYTFGAWTPWWSLRGSNDAESTTQNFSAKTDATGVHDLKIDFGQISPPRPMTVRAQASVTDVNRQRWAATTNVLVHPGSHYVGLKSDTYFVEKGTPLEFDVVVSDIDGNLVPERPVKVRATRVSFQWRDGEYQEVEKDPQDCEVMTADEPVTCTFQTKVGGRYKIVATTVDDQRRSNFTKVTRWVSGGDYPKSRNVEMEEVQIIPDRDEYAPGETAKLLVQTPIVPSEVFMSLRRNGMVEERRFRMEESTRTVEVPIKNVHMPNLFVQVNVVGEQPRLGSDGEPDESLPTRPAYGAGQIDLKVPPSERVLDVALEPAADRVSPGAKTSVDVTVKRADGKPATNTEVAVVVVDEAILALSSYQMADPMEVFYPHRNEGTSDHHIRSAVSLVDPANLQAQGGPAPSKRIKKKSMAPQMEMGSASTGAAKPAAPAEEGMAMDMLMADGEADLAAGNAFGGGGDSAPKIAVRSNFTPLAAFAPAVKTGDDGKATVSIEMPDNLTRYRIMAVAVEDGTRYGTGESNITARLPLMVRPSPPRFLNFGDTFELPVVVQNQTDEEMQVKVASRATNIEFADARGWRVMVPANDRVEVRFPASTAMAGTARFQVAAATDGSADASEFDLPVWTPATSEAFATYGTVDEGAIAQSVKTPGEVWPQFGQLEVTTSSTALSELTDAFLYLYDYDYQCAEQISSRVVSVAALRDVLTAFEAEGMPTEKEVERSMKRDIEELAGRQNYDGGFGLWRKGQKSWPFVSIHAAHALSRAQQKGYEVPANVMNRSRTYLSNIERFIPGWYSEWLRLHVISYALYVRDTMGDTDAAKAREVVRRAGKLENLSFESLGWLLNVMSGDAASKKELGDIRQYLANRVTETAGAAHYAVNTTDQDYVIMRSNRVADGIVLEALIEDQPKTDLIPKIVRGLLANRQKGRWSNTQENAFVLLALDRYFNAYEDVTPNFVARAWLGDRYAGEHTFRGRTTEQHQIDIPMRWLVDNTDGPKDLLLQKDGKGRMYYRIGMQYAPKDLYLEPADHGFVVERTYSAVDDPDDVKRRDDGTWEVRAGAKVKIELTMVAPTRRYHVALVDPIPAGFETMNPALAVTGDVPIEASNTGRDSTYGWWWFTRPWYEHQNLRDERTEAFATIVWGGVHSYTYYARATTPGTFVVPPAKAEEMYSPETFGRSASERVVVK